VSRVLSAPIAATQKTLHPGVEASYRDLPAVPLGHLNGAHLAAAQGAVPADAVTERDIALGEEMLDEFLAADIVLVGAPMYNFGVPPQLKAWIDRLAVAGKTFRYTAEGPQGLAGGKEVIVASSRCGLYGPGTPAASLDHQESYLRGVFNFFGCYQRRGFDAEPPG
jgi:FMN-dependent NADH-azoreductase